MGNGWAVGAASVLGLSAAMASVRQMEAPLRFGGVDHPLDLVRLVLVVAVVGTWAYALVTATQGRRSAVLALLALVLLFGVGLQGVATLAKCAGGACGPITLGLAGVNLLAGLLAAVALVQEARRRKGPLHLLHATGIVLPALLLVFLRYAGAA